MTRTLATFPQRGEFDKARSVLEDLGLDCEIIWPDPGYARVGVPALAMDAATRLGLAPRDHEFVCSGWVDYRRAAIPVPLAAPAEFAEDVFGAASIMVLAPCVADPTRIRLIAHISGDLTEVFPYLNAVMPSASYNRNGSTFTFMDGYRMISLRPRRIAVAKADELVDAWRILEALRRQVNEVWAQRAELEPCYDTRERPAALEIYKCLPRSNCHLCGEPTCLAFAWKVWQGQLPVGKCRPVFEGDQTRLKDALVEICAGLGVAP